MTRRGHFSMLIIDRNIVIVGREYRSKWWKVSCTCSKWRRRKDGSCKHERLVLDHLVPEIRKYAHIEPMCDS